MSVAVHAFDTVLNKLCYPTPHTEVAHVCSHKQNRPNPGQWNTEYWLKGENEIKKLNDPPTETDQTFDQNYLIGYATDNDVSAAFVSEH